MCRKGESSFYFFLGRHLSISCHMTDLRDIYYDKLFKEFVVYIYSQLFDSDEFTVLVT